MFSVKPIWWVPVVLCIVLGFLSFIPVDTSQNGAFLPYQSLIPLAPISSLLILFVGGGFFFVLGRWATGKPIRTP